MQTLVSFVLLTFNQSRTVQAALQSLLAQSYTPLEIVISDDHSSDGTWELICSEVSRYEGPHHIKINQNPKNLGLNGNCNKAFSIASGELIILAAGDDISLPHRASRTVEHWLKANRKPRLIVCPVIDMTADGIPLGRIEVTDLGKIHSLTDWFRQRPYVIGAGHAWHRSLFHDFQPLPTGLNHEDQIASYRAALLDAGSTIDEPLVMHRRGGSSSQTTLESPQAWLRKRHLDATRDAVFWRQLLLDASRFPVDVKLLRQVRRILARCLFEARMISATGLTDQLRTLITHPETDLGFRARTFFNVRFASVIFRTKLQPKKTQT